MSKEIYISSTPHETRLAIVENDDLTEIYYERENEYTLAGSIYNGRVTRVLPGMQSSFVDIGLERDAFLYITDFMEEAGDSADFDSNGDHSHGRRTTESASGQEESEKRNSRHRSERRRGNRDRRAGWEKPRNAEEQESNTQEASVDGEFSEGEQEKRFSSEDAALSETQDNSQIGEGAPGADGSRRWRGRRGRRRGRSGQRDFSSQANDQAQPEPSFSPEEQGDDDSPEASFDVEAGAETSSFSAEAAEAYPEHRNRSERNERNDHRNGRDRNRRRTPRGFAPRTSLYGVDDSAETQEEISAEPIILPGESLSKYRTGGNEPQAAAGKAPEPTVTLPSRPSYEIPSGWDGGAILPGETLSRHRRPATQAAPEVAEAESVESTPYEQPVTQETFEPASPAETVEPVEYEPTEASASYRVDPVAPSEFRHNAPVIDDEQPVSQEHEEAPTHEFTSIHATGEMMDEPSVPSFTPEAEEPVSPLQHETVIADPAENVIENSVAPLPQQFAPGAGELEEEIIDDEEYAPVLHASRESGEEETLEGAADLGTMIREMSIDEITGSGSADEDDELEELEEEDTFDDSDLSGQEEYGEELEEQEPEEEELEESAHGEFGEEAEHAAADAVEPGAGYERPHDSDRSRSRRDSRRGRHRYNGN
ncbi:MAG TPA: hypothetical protein VFE38_10665, partial [Edaphobacter sp.]|nr:hypothetical protein [Edaphobacter sp.]